MPIENVPVPDLVTVPALANVLAAPYQLTSDPSAGRERVPPAATSSRAASARYTSPPSVQVPVPAIRSVRPARNRLPAPLSESVPPLATTVAPDPDMDPPLQV